MMNTRKKILHTWLCLALLLGLFSQVIEPVQATPAGRANTSPAAPLAYTLTANPNAVHPGGVVALSGSGYAPNTTYFLRYEMPQKASLQHETEITLAFTQTLTSNNLGQIFDTYTFDPTLADTCLSGCYFAIYDNPNAYPPALTTTPVALLSRLILSISPNQGAPGDTINFRVNNLEAGHLMIDLGGQMVYGPAEVAARTHTASFTVPLYPRGNAGDVLSLTFLNLVNGLPMAMRTDTFTLVATAPPPAYEFTNLVITPTRVAPGMPFTITGQITPVGGGLLAFGSTAASTVVLEAMWEHSKTGIRFPVNRLADTVGVAGEVIFTGQGASTLTGEPYSMYDDLSIQLFAKFKKPDIVDVVAEVPVYGPITETLQVQAVDAYTQDPIPGVIVTIEYKCTIRPNLQCMEAIRQSGWRGTEEEFSHGMPHVVDAWHNIFTGSQIFGELTDANGNAKVNLVGEGVIVNPLNWQTLDSLHGHGYQQAGAMPADAAGESINWNPGEPYWQKYELTVSGLVPEKDLRYFYNPDTFSSFHTVLWYQPGDDSVFIEAMDDYLLLTDIYDVPMVFVEAEDPQTHGPTIMMQIDRGSYLGDVYQDTNGYSWPKYDGFLDFSILKAYTISVTGLPNIKVSFTWPNGELAPLSPELWLDGVKKSSFARSGNNYTASFAYPDTWPANGIRQLSLKALWGKNADAPQDPMERMVYLSATPAATWLAYGQDYTSRSVSYNSFADEFIFRASDSTSYGADEVSTSSGQTPQTGPLTNNLAPAIELVQKVSNAGFITNEAEANSQAPTALSLIGASQSFNETGTVILFDEMLDPPLYVIIPLYAAAISDPLGGWLVTITSGGYVAASASMHLTGSVNVGAGGQTSTNLTLDTRATAEGTVFLTMDVLMGILAHGEMTVVPGIGLQMPLSITDGAVDVGQICFGYWMGMSYFIGAGCGCVFGFCECLFSDSGSAELFSGSLPTGCWYTALSKVVPAARRYGPPAPGEPACPAAVAAISPEQYHTVMAADGYGQVTALYKKGLHTFEMASYDYGSRSWVVDEYNITTLGAEVPSVAYYQRGKAVVTWNAYNGDEDVLPTLPITEAMRTTYVAWGLRDGFALYEMGALAEHTNGAGGAVLGSCTANTAGCPAGGQVTAAWMVDRVPGLADNRTQLYYRTFENGTWGTPTAIPLDSNDSDAQPQVLYVDGQPLIAFVRDEDGLIETADDRRIAFYDPANPGVVDVPSELPDHIIEFSAAAASDGTLRLAFNRIDMPNVGLLDNRHTLFTAQQDASGEWSFVKPQDSYGRVFYVESPSLTLNVNDEASIGYRAMGMSPLPGQYGNPYDYTPRPGDTAGMATRTGESASLSFSNFDQQEMTPAYLTGDGAVNWENVSFYDAFSQQTFQIGTRFGAVANNKAIAGLNSNPGVSAQPLVADSSLTFATLTDEPDFVVYAEAPASPYISDTQTTVITVTVQNVGMGWEGAGTPLRIAASWDAPDGAGIPAGETFVDQMAAGSSTTLALTITAPVNAVITHTLYVQALPPILTTERSTVNNTATLTFGGLPAPDGLSSAMQSGVEAVILRWAASTDVRVVGYRIYRSTDGGEFEAVGSSLGSEWLDLLAPLNHTYTYYVTAFTAEGVESPPSDTTTTKITEVWRLPMIYLPLVVR